MEKRTFFLLPVSPYTRQRLLVGRRVPVGVEENQAVRANQVDTAPAGLAGQQEHELLRVVGVVELVDHLLPLRRRHRAVQAEVTVSAASFQHPVIHRDPNRPHLFPLSIFSNRSSVCV